MPTARNARGVDIIAYSYDASRYIGIQVKALSKRAAVPLGTSLDKVIGDFWIVIDKVSTQTPSTVILLPSEVRQHATRNEKGAQASYWLEPAVYEQTLYKDASDRIGGGGG
jgi:hypothetical protein